MKYLLITVFAAVLSVAALPASAEPLSREDVDVGFVYDRFMPTTVLATEEITLPNSYSATDETFDEVMRVAITPESTDALIRIRVSPHFFRTDSRVSVYWRLVRKVTGQADVEIADQVQVTRFGVYDEQIVCYDRPGTTTECAYVLEARGRGFSQSQSVYIPSTCYRMVTEEVCYGLGALSSCPPPDIQRGNQCCGVATYRRPYDCSYTSTSTVTVTSSRKCGLRALALIAAEQGDDIAIPPN